MFIHIILHILSKDLCCWLVLLKGWLLLRFCRHSLRCNDISFPMGLHILLNRVQRRLMMSCRLIRHLNFRLSYYKFSEVYTVRYTNLLFYMHLPLTSMYILFFRLPHTLALPALYTSLLFRMPQPLTVIYISFFRLPHTSLLPARYTNRPLNTPLLPTAMYILFFRLPRAKFPSV